MSTSMIINDLFDIEIDKANKTNRPLVTGEVTKLEAILYIFSMSSLTLYLSKIFLSSNLQDIIQFSLINLILYTPFYKKLFLIKNIFCAYFVAFAFFMGGNSVTKTILSLNHNFNIFVILLSVLFFGSLYNEILLDIKDYHGDKQFNIKTIPVVMGKENAWYISSIILIYNIISSSFSLMYIKGYLVGFLLLFINVPIINSFFLIKQSNYSKDSIMNAVNVSSGENFPIIIGFFLLMIYV
jgi:geranylgeranylglycerol-phosphate geranylgeranyltransferase